MWRFYSLLCKIFNLLNNLNNNTNKGYFNILRIYFAAKTHTDNQYPLLLHISIPIIFFEKYPLLPRIGNFRKRLFSIGQVQNKKEGINPLFTNIPSTSLVLL